MRVNRSREREAEAAPGRVPAVARAAQILSWVGGCAHPVSLTEIAQALGLPKSSALAICRTLVGERFLERDAGSGGYRLGPQILDLSHAYLQGLDVAQAFHRVLGMVPEANDETVQLALLDGTDVVYVAKRDGTARVPFQRVGCEIGQRLPASCSSTGRSMLACLEDEQVRGLYTEEALPRLTPNSPATVEALLVDLARVRERGYAVDDEAVSEGLACVGAAVRGPAAGRPAASVSVVLFRARLSPELEGRLAAMVRTVADRLSGTFLDNPTLRPGR
ncbi:MAG: IclR family transcriptional regulator [Candidatus Dormibacteraeota bacterium]|nr:IclR family transcriptional regulator [Candidatus Dormibacteraeota bacterium]